MNKKELHEKLIAKRWRGANTDLSEELMATDVAYERDPSDTTLAPRCYKTREEAIADLAEFLKEANMQTIGEFICDLLDGYGVRAVTQWYLGQNIVWRQTRKDTLAYLKRLADHFDASQSLYDDPGAGQKARVVCGLVNADNETLEKQFHNTPIKIDDTVRSEDPDMVKRMGDW